jgi:hypothetical protein
MPANECQRIKCCSGTMLIFAVPFKALNGIKKLLVLKVNGELPYGLACIVTHSRSLCLFPSKAVEYRKWLARGIDVSQL